MDSDGFLKSPKTETFLQLKIQMDSDEKERA
jgi:hypothetical protein